MMILWMEQLTSSRKLYHLAFPLRSRSDLATLTYPTVHCHFQWWLAAGLPLPVF
jgi:hypothetical protein